MSGGTEFHRFVFAEHASNVRYLVFFSLAEIDTELTLDDSRSVDLEKKIQVAEGHIQNDMSSTWCSSAYTTQMSRKLEHQHRYATDGSQ